MNNKCNHLYFVMVSLLAILIACEPQRDVLEGMALIPAGEFQMGTRYASDEKSEYSKDIMHMHAWMDEQPVHTVYLDSYYIDKYPVTNKQYKAFILANPDWQKERINPKYHDGNYLRDWNGNNYPRWKGNHPVTSVSWYAAMAYAAWSGKRLPTEAEWEKAARGGLQNKRFPWGDSIDRNKANYGEHIGKTTPIDKYPPNPYGLYDMSGNVMEMVLDEYVVHYYSISPRVNPLSGADTIQDIVENFKDVKTHRVLRGGAWPSHFVYFRVAERNTEAPTSTGELGGFRCVKDIPITAKDVINKETVEFISADPPNGSKIKPNTIITLSFDGIPKNIKVNQGNAPFSNSMVTVKNNKIVTVIGIFRPGELNLEIAWNKGFQKIVYHVEAPVAENIVLIPEGTFEMGHIKAKNKSDNKVYIEAFYIDKYEVTVGEYKQFVSETGHRSPDWDKIAEYAPSDKHPMIFVNWFDAMLYARWVGKRLPTEVEWEKAARGGLVGKKYPWGNTPPDSTQTNFAGTIDNYKYTAPGGSFLPNEYGLYDMMGNVREWCLDNIHNYSDGDEVNNTQNYGEIIADTTTNFSKVRSARGVRGGSWFSESYHLNGVYQSDIPASHRYPLPKGRGLCFLATAVFSES